MSMPSIIGLAGPSGVGKDHLALTVFRPMGYEIMALADSGRPQLAVEHDMDMSRLFGERTPEDRDLMVAFFEGKREEFGEPYWCDRLLEGMNLAMVRRDQRAFVIPDVRRQFEVDFIERLGGVVLQVRAPKRLEARANGITEAQRLSPTEATAHELRCHGTIYNDEGDEAPLSQILTLFGVTPVIDPRFRLGAPE